MKKIVSTVIASVVMLSSTTVFASSNIENKYFEFLVPKIEQQMTTQNIMPTSIEEINKELNRIEAEFNATLTEEKRNAALLVVNELKSVSDSSEIDTLSLIDYDKFYNDLRKGNYIEGVLDLDEGLSAIDIAKIGTTHASTARDAALKKYPNAADVMLRDAYRHFTWNYVATKDLGAIKTRTATINHEWGLLLIEPITNYYNNRYNYYVSNGTSSPANKAFLDATAYLPDLKFQLILLCQDNINTFKGLFTDANIMDFHNNVYGRAYAESHPSGYDSAFTSAKNAGDLILSESSVTNWNYTYVWQNNWWTE